MTALKSVAGLVLAVSLLVVDAPPAAASTTTLADIAGDAWGVGVVPLAERSDERIDALGASVSYDSATETLTMVIDVVDIDGDRGLGPVGLDQSVGDESLVWFVTFTHAGNDYDFYGYRYLGMPYQGTCFQFTYLEAFPNHVERGFECHESGVDVANNRVTISFSLSEMNEGMAGWGSSNTPFAPGDTLEGLQIVTTRDEWIADRSLPTDTRSLTLA